MNSLRISVILGKTRNSLKDVICNIKCDSNRQSVEIGHADLCLRSDFVKIKKSLADCVILLTSLNVGHLCLLIVVCLLWEYLVYTTSSFWLLTYLGH